MRVTIWSGVWLTAVLWLSACQTQVEVTSPSLLNNAEYVIINETMDEKDLEKKTLDTSRTDQISGSGKIAFNHPLQSKTEEEGGNRSIQQFELNFSLDGDGSSVSLYAFSKGNVQDGVEFNLALNEGKLTGRMKFGLYPAVTLKEGTFNSISSDQEISLRFVIDNEGDTTLLQIYSGSDLLVDSSTLEVAGRGVSDYWGVGLIKSTVTRAENQAL